jgi:hypothetical protein
LKERKLKRVILYALVLTLGLAMEQAKADFTISEPTNLGPIINSSAQEHAANISADGLSLFLTSDRSGGFGSDDIWVTTRATINDSWSEPINLEPPVNSSYPDGFPSISADGLTLYFSANNRPGIGGPGGADIWMTTRSTKSVFWGNPVNLGSPVNSASFESTQSISSDGLTLYFDSDRPGGSGDSDLWVTTRSTINDNWNTPINLGSIVNSSSLERGPSISSDSSTLFFESNRPGGSGGRDIWMTTRATKDGSWNEPVNLGPTVNTARWDKRPNISADGLTLYFSSYDRSGGYGHYDIWKVAINPIVDLNGDGKVDAIDICIMVDHWGEDYSLCDIGPMPWGDATIDVEDLKVLSEHLFEQVEDPTLIAHWALDETEGMTAHNNVSGNDDFIMGNPLWQPSEGKLDGALELDGIDDCIISSVDLNPAKGPFSVVVWIKGGAPGQVIISRPSGSDWLAINTEGKLMTLLKSLDQSDGPLLSQEIITDGKWHRIGLVWDGLRRKLNIDGVTVAEDTLDGLNPLGGGLYIGVGESFEADSFFSGLIDEIRIYKRAVSP